MERSSLEGEHDEPVSTPNQLQDLREEAERLREEHERLQMEHRHALLRAETAQGELAIAVESIARLRVDREEARMPRIVLLFRKDLPRAVNRARGDPRYQALSAQIPAPIKAALKSVYWRIVRKRR